MAFQATFCIVTAALVSGAVVERMRFGAVPRSSPRSGRCSSTRCSRTGPSAAAGCRRTARSTSPAACRSRWAPASRRSRLRSSSARARTTGARPCSPQRGLRPAWRRPAVVRLVRLQRRQRLLDRQRERAGVHEHAAGPACTLLVWFLLDLDPRAQVTAIGAATAIVVGCVAITRPAASSARAGRWRWRARRRCPAMRSSSGARAPASTRRSTSSPPTASRASSGSSSSASSREIPGTASPTASSTATPRSSATGAGRARGPAYAFLATFVLLKLFGL